MNKRSMFAIIVTKSLRKRVGRVWVAILAVAVGATLTSSLLTVSTGIEGAVERELRSYGANVLLMPKDALINVGSGDLSFGSVSERKFLKEESLREIGNVVPGEKLVGYAPYLYVPVKMELYLPWAPYLQINSNADPASTVVFVGTWLGEMRQISPWWRAEGSWIQNRSGVNEVMLGKTLAEKMGAKAGVGLRMSYQGHTEDVKIAGILSTSGPEDNQIVGTLGLAQRVAGQPGSVHIVWVSMQAQSRELETLAKKVEEAVPSSEAKLIGQVVQAEETVLSKMSFTMILLVSFVLIASGLGVMSTLSTSVMERRSEIGLLKALGAEEKTISMLQLSEASLIGLAGGVIGYLAGASLASLIGLAVFGRALAPQPQIFLITALMSLVLVLTASIIPVRQALRVESAVVLRGE